MSIVSNLCVWGKSIFKIVMNKWMIWNNYSELLLVNICDNNILTPEMY